ncbi:MULTISPECIES: hypothetical protein [Nitrospirillum]|nr:hypothetical protein [Nitrospirillum amazonense]MEC4589842.1 hypothetical protein [Nitrospirillum amazonense]
MEKHSGLMKGRRGKIPSAAYLFRVVPTLAFLAPAKNGTVAEALFTFRKE